MHEFMCALQPNMSDLEATQHRTAALVTRAGALLNLSTQIIQTREQEVLSMYVCYVCMYVCMHTLPSI